MSVGDYALETVGGAPLPYVLQETPVRRELTAERFTLYNDGTYILERTVRDGTALQTTTSEGRYSLYRTTFTFNELAFAEGLEMFSQQGTLTADRFTLTTGGWGQPVVAWVFRQVQPSW
jgi:hypothetical protein